MRNKYLFLCVLLMSNLMLNSGCVFLGEDRQNSAAVLDPKKPVTITLWHYYVSENQQALEKAISEFNQTLGIEKGIIVEAVAKGSITELEKAVSNSAMGVINSDPMPEIFSCYPDKALEIDELGMIADLNPYFTEEEKEAYVSEFLADGMPDRERLLMLPIVKSTELLYVNRSAWDEFTSDYSVMPNSLGTWENLLETSKQYYNWMDSKTPDIPWDGKAMMGFDSVANFILAGSRQLDADLIESGSSKVNLHSQALRRIFEIYCRGISMGYFNAAGKFRSDDIKAGELIAYVGSSSSAAYFPTWIEKNSQQKNIRLLPAPYPVFEQGEPSAVQQGAGMAISVSTPAKQKASAVFLKWFGETKQNVDFAMTTGYLPVKKTTYESQDYQVALERLKNGDRNQKNVAAVYEIALQQVRKSSTYAMKPFKGSYDLRFIFQDSLMEEAKEMKKTVDEWKAQGMQEAEIIEAMDMDAAYGRWVESLKLRMNEKKISYREQS